MESSLRSYITSQLDLTTARAPSSGAFTVGLEHEFFLLSSNKKSVVSHEESQAFLRHLSNRPGWYIREQSDSELGPMIQRVSLEAGARRYTAVKYDHHPHLMEIAFAYTDTLFELRDQIDRVFTDLASTADKCGLRASHMPRLDLPADDLRLQSPLADFKALRHYRTKLFERRGEQAHPHHSNYAAVIAASQVHIGGTQWWRHRNYVEALYLLEPHLLSFGTHHLLGNAETRAKILRTRWEGYQAVFQGYPLVGFPDLEQFDFFTWTQALFNSPLAGSAQDAWAAHTLRSLPTSPFEDWTSFLLAVRDLQIIRPRLYGTLEFRADPAQPDPEALTALAALRMGLCTQLMRQPLKEAGTFKQARTQWWQNVRT